MEFQYIAAYDNYKYITDDIIFYDSINKGESGPYPIDFEIVNKYGTYIDVGSHIRTTIMPYSNKI